MSSTFYLYSAAVSRGGRNSIAPTSASPVRYRQAFRTLQPQTDNKQTNEFTNNSLLHQNKVGH